MTKKSLVLLWELYLPTANCPEAEAIVNNPSAWAALALIKTTEPEPSAWENLAEAVVYAPSAWDAKSELASEKYPSAWLAIAPFVGLYVLAEVKYPSAWE